MNSVLETIQIAVVMGLMFSIAFFIEWAALRGFFWAISTGLRPAGSTAPDLAARVPREVR